MDSSSSQQRSQPISARSRVNHRTRNLRVQDARGREVLLLDPLTLRLLRRHDIIPDEPLGKIVDEIGFGTPKWQVRGYLLSITLFAACVIFLIIWKLYRGRGPDVVEKVLWPVNIGVFVFGAVQFWRSGRRARAKHVCRVMLEHRRCPHCGYDLRGLPRDPADETTVCPECGCAWQMDVGESVVVQE